MSNVKGSAVTARLRYVKERHQSTGYIKLLNALTPAHRNLIEGRILAHAWVPYDLFIDVNVQCDKLFGKGDLQLCYELGRFAADVNLPTLYRLFYKIGTPMFILRQASRLWGLHYDSGTMEAIDESHGVRLIMRDLARPHRAHCISVLGWASKSIELSGATIVQAEEPRCRRRNDPQCELVLAWR